MMERMAWTDERLDDLSRRMDNGFERVDADIRELRGEVRDGFQTMNRKIDEGLLAVNGRIDEGLQAINGKMDAGFQATNGKVEAGYRLFFQVGGGVIVGLVGVIAAVMVRG